MSRKSSAPREGKAGKPASGLRARLEKLGLFSDFDLLLHLPLRYVDETHLYPIAHAPLDQPVLVEGTVVDAEVRYKPRRQLVARLADESGELTVRLFNFYPSQVKLLAPGARLRVVGEIRGGFLGREMVHPRFRTAREEEALPEALTPVYPTTAGLSQDALRKAVGKALASLDLADTLPDEMREALGLAEFAPSVRFLHGPPPDARLAELEDRSHPAWRRLKFDELLAQQLSMRLHYRRRREKAAPPLPPTGSLTRALLATLPFQLTRAQARVMGEVSRDLAQSHPMQRLLQGDVGSGKTVVAALAALQAVENGYQAAVMAPTEILAEQHYAKFAAWLEPLGLQVAWLVSSLPKKEKDAMLAAVAEGRAHVAVGTHALFQEQVAFARLGLAVVDEQHRFGVHQRLALRQKGEGEVHQLMMSATPIPRTLSMSYYADLDVSVIDELPPGRSPVDTRLVSDARRDEVIARVREACLAGRQAYWVCPLIEESEALQLKTAVETHAALAATFPDLRLGLVHGRLKPAEKAAVMSAFKTGEIQLLVATTVIEVGVDVPNASLMVIDHAERMGLAQLHQLRGRVGRGATRSVCLLLYTQPLSETARERLKVIRESTDGFEIARHDLRIRGPGEFLGVRQSGVPMLRVADLEADADLLEPARRVAEQLLAEAPERAERHLARWLGGRQAFLKA